MMSVALRNTMAMSGNVRIPERRTRRKTEAVSMFSMLSPLIDRVVYVSVQEAIVENEKIEMKKKTISSALMSQYSH